MPRTASSRPVFRRAAAPYRPCGAGAAAPGKVWTLSAVRAPGAYRGGPDALVFDRQVQAITGRSLESPRGAHKLKSIVLD